MDKNKIKSFAIWARRNLISAVSDKAERIGISRENIEEAIAVQGGFKLAGKEEIFPLSKSDRDALVKQVKEKGFEQVMEEVAYTWFNRFMGIRYMEVNDYLPLGVRVLSSEVEGKTEPDVLSRVSEIIEELHLNAEEIYGLLDTGKTEDREKAYKIILVKQCNELGKIIPQMFEKIADYTELLLPDNLLEEGSVIRKMVEDIEESDWREEVEIVGWLYQYYVSEKKIDVDEKIRAGKKVSKENLPVKTQIFTPKWIVKYMVENCILSVCNVDKEIKYKYKFAIENDKKIDNDDIEKIKIIDPCQGSGHILLYAFDVLYDIYRSKGYSEREIPEKILRNNIFGIDVDKRSAQLATFALIMKARHYDKRLFRKIEKNNISLNISYIEESDEVEDEIVEYFLKDNEELREDLSYLLKKFKNSKQFGSLLRVKNINFDPLFDRLNEIENDNNLMFSDYRNVIINKFRNIFIQAKILGQHYDIVITNPPYLGKKKGMNKELCKFVEDEYEKSKMDLFSAFIERSFDFAKIDGYIALVTPYSWMFLTSYKELRREIIDNKSIVSLVQLNEDTFNDATVSTCCFVIKNNKEDKNGEYIKLSTFTNEEQEERLISAVKSIDRKYTYSINKEIFKLIPDNRIAYWIDKNIVNCFKEKSLGEVVDIKSGMFTSDNDRFLRLWHEVSIERVNLNCKSITETEQSTIKWYPYNKGGKKLKWYGNNEYLINWENNGEEVKNFAASKYKTYTRSIKNIGYFFKKCITWSDISGTDFAARACGTGFIFDVKGSCAFPEEKDYEITLALLNSRIVPMFVNILNPTVTTQVGDLKQIPFVTISEENSIRIRSIVEECIEISKKQWDSEEKSWNFRKHSALNNKMNTIKKAYEFVLKEYEEEMIKLQQNEDIINKIFSYEYNIVDKFENKREKYIISENDFVKSFISYVIGCMFGRYSIDAEGLIYAGGDFNDKWNFGDKLVRKIEKDEDGNVIYDKWVKSRFMPDRENIIPITEDEYFEDDIVARFIEFVRLVYGEENLEENLEFIADSIGRKASETARQAIRRYFIKDFYKDHLKVYQKRPIYWMLDSGKNDGFKALVYMHRYNEQTVAKVRTEYLHVLQRKYEAMIELQQSVIDSDSSTAKDKTAAKKKIDKINKQIEECREYDQVVAYLANEQINIDLDDGVKVNYAKFQDVKVINSKGKEVKMNLLSKI